ncbi:MAG: DUF1761 domain-containing protein [Rubricoccaceae bacterium]|nr:DUF1761 domain-containing protein [Rubricoccaceae bacterium]
MLGHVDFASINYISVLVAAVLAFGVGSIWYGKPLFANTWMKEVGLTEEQIQQGNMGMIFGGTFVMSFIAMLFLDIFIGQEAGALVGALHGAIIAAVFIGTSLASNYLFSQRSTKLFLIDAGYDVVRYALAGAVLGAW